MAQVTTSTTVHDVVVIGSGAGGGTVTKVLADLGISVLLMEAGPMIGPADFKEHMWPYDVPHRGAGAEGAGLHRRADRLHLQRHLRRRAARGRAVHGGAGQRLLVVPIARPRRPHQPLRPRDAADGRLRLQAEDDRRPRLRLADQLRRTWRPYYDKAERFIGVTGSAGRHPQRARRHLQPAGAAPGARHPGPASRAPSWASARWPRARR